MSVSDQKVLLVDFNNAVHRARAGFGKGDHSITYTFFLMFRKMVETHSPNKVCIVLEGRPTRRKEEYGEYKANRISAGDEFWRQHTDIKSLLSHLPVTVVRHANHECDDVIAHLANVTYADHQCTVVSTDTDFIQLLVPGNDRVRLYNPIKEEYIVAPTYDYVEWKSLTGDGSDNISGFNGIGGKRAQKLVENRDLLEKFLSDEEHKKKFERNLGLIRFETLQEQPDSMTFTPDYQVLRDKFYERKFFSIINDKSWTRFTNTFDAVTCS